MAFDQDNTTRFGLIALATDLTSEGDAGRAFSGSGIVMHTTRIAFENPTTPASLTRMQPLLTQAARLIVPDVPLAAIWYACTAASALIGDGPVTAAIRAARPHVPVVTPPAAAIQAFRRLGATRIAVLAPYQAQTTQGLLSYFNANGLEIVNTLSLGIDDDRDMARVSAKSIIDAARAADHPQAEALFVSCTALPAMAIVDLIEAAVHKPVVTANQASLWHLAEICGTRLQAQCRLFATQP
ncbi:MAG: ectoine utilization protein EutA [Paracoccaceae bacterium]